MATLKDFTATGDGPHGNVGHRDLLTYAVAGTFVGTVVLEKSESGGLNWVTIASTSTTLSLTLLVENTNSLGDAWYRFRCTAYTSGTIETSITSTVAILPGGGVWGQIDGSISAQADLVAALALKANSSTVTSLTTTVGTKVDKIVTVDNVILRADGIAGAVQNSGVTVDDSNNVQMPASTNLYLGGLTTTKLTTASSGNYAELYGNQRTNIYVGGVLKIENTATRTYVGQLLAGMPGTSAASVTHSGGLLYSTYAVVSNTYPAESAALYTYSAAANQLTTDGQGYFWELFGAFDVNGNTKTIRVYANGTGIGGYAVTTSGGYFRICGSFVRTAASLQVFEGILTANSSGGTASIRGSVGTTNLTSASLCPFTVTLESSAKADDVYLYGFRVWYIPQSPI